MAPDSSSYAIWTVGQKNMYYCLNGDDTLINRRRRDMRCNAARSTRCLARRAGAHNTPRARSFAPPRMPLLLFIIRSMSGCHGWLDLWMSISAMLPIALSLFALLPSLDLVII